jgi:hypothetical protein
MKSAFRFLFLFGVMVGLLSWGCGSSDIIPSDLGSLLEGRPPTGDAQVSFKIVLPEAATAGRLNPSVLAASTGRPVVTFRIILIDASKPSNPLVTFLSTVEASPDGTAQVSFSGLPLWPMVGQIQIDGGSIGG